MKVCFFVVLLSIFMTSSLFAEQMETIVKLKTNTGTLEGSLIVPDEKGAVPVALIIAGSGPTDRNGNNVAMNNNSLKMLAEALSKNGIATVRYDKRGVGKSQKAGLKEDKLRFDHYISDAKAWAELLKNDKRFNRVVIIGHSEGSLIGMIAAQKSGVDQFISIAGSGISADKTLLEQLKSQPPEVLNIASPIIDKLKQGETVSDVNPMLYSLFRPSVQPYLISWFKHDPAEELAKLKIPTLIIQGTTDIQVREEDAKILAEANPQTDLKIIKGMNHIFKEASLDRMKNIETYNQPNLPIKQELVVAISDFVNKNKR
ncbi:alpha/beta hydrolase [Alteromonas sp. a30]|uniref:alpha/beta hydrolase n=1 Tax=Alteromonas sp. a30 TaxID=2730917 RepID=UPI002282FC54|nr:alpha/beta fold hydrolase [Alteromonas sp. a30]MCY7294958.1 alpha/beta fold hydrolase [Alteromonas sp. a30]